MHSYCCLLDWWSGWWEMMLYSVKQKFSICIYLGEAEGIVCISQCSHWDSFWHHISNTHMSNIIHNDGIIIFVIVSSDSPITLTLFLIALFRCGWMQGGSKHMRSRNGLCECSWRSPMCRQKLSRQVKARLVIYKWLKSVKYRE